MPPVSLFTPMKSWKEPKHTMGRDLSAARYWASMPGSPGDWGRDMNCQPSKSTWVSMSSRQAVSTAGLKVSISTRVKPIFRASW